MTGSDAPLRVGLIGYGVAGGTFHAPLIEAAPGLVLASVVTSSEARAAAARAAHPGVSVLDSVEALLEAASAHDVVVVASPNRFHVEQGMAALAAGLHVVVDKPLAAGVSEAGRLVARAAESDLVAAVFQNRRWDGDFLTLSRLVEDGRLGDVWRFESRFERWRPEVRSGAWREGADPADAGGLLYDLGSHLIDQALVLLGPVARVYGELAVRRPGAEVDDDSFVALEHVSGARSHLWMSQTAARLGPRFRVLGSRAGYVKWGLDVQEAALREGARVDGPGFGVEEESAWGSLGAEGGGGSDKGPDGAAVPAVIPTEPGRYLAFYEGLERAVRDGVPSPVPLEAGVRVLDVIEAAQESARSGEVVGL